MKLTAKGRYAVTAIAALAARGHGECASLRQISEEQGIPQPFLEQVFAQLRQAGIVESVRGKTGGYRLTRSADDISVEQLISAVDIDVRAQGCTPDMKTACTGVGSRCLTHDLWHALEDHIETFLANVTVADILDGKVREVA